MNAIAQLVTYVYGSSFIVLCLSFIVYGITTAQAYVYWVKFPLDTKWIRWTVLIIWVTDSIHTAICMTMLYYYVISDLGNFLGVLQINWAPGTTILLIAVLVFIVEIFFVRRIWILSGGRIVITVVPAIFVVVQAGFNIANSVLLLTGGEWTTYRSEELTYVMTILSLFLIVTTDAIITSILIFYLRKSRTGFHSMNDHLAKVQIYLINSGALTTAVAMSVLLAFVCSRDTLAYGGLQQLLCKSYTNAFLGTLNVRKGNAKDDELAAEGQGRNTTEVSTAYNDSQYPVIEILRHAEVNRGTTREPVIEPGTVSRKTLSIV